MLEKFKGLIKQKETDVLNSPNPKHVAITLGGVGIWAKENKLNLEDGYKKSGLVLKEVIKEQMEHNIPIITFYLLPDYMERSSEPFLKLVDHITLFFEELSSDELLKKNKIRASVLGKWYDLTGRAVDSIKKLMESTKEHDNFFINFCVNYSGQEEITDACKLMARQVKSGRLDPELINKEMIKENIYSSNFLPPELLIKNGPRKRTNGLLLWDSSYTFIHFSDRLWPDFSKKDFDDALRAYKGSK